MPGIINTGSFPAGLRPGVKRWFGISYKQWPTEWTQIGFEVVPSDRAYEDYAGTVGYGLAQAKPEGSSVTYDSARQGFMARIDNCSFALGAMVTYEELKDGNWGPVSLKRSKALARSCQQTEENIHALVLSRAFTTGYTGADGSILCVTSHKNKSDNTTYSNCLAAAADLSELAIEQLTIQIMQATDDRGLTAQLKVKTLVIAPNDVYTAHRILKSVKQSGTANNDTNALRDMGAVPDIAVNRYFNAGNGAWFLVTDCPDGLISQEREKIRFGQDNDFDTENFKMKAFFRRGVGWADPRGIYGSAGAA